MRIKKRTIMKKVLVVEDHDKCYEIIAERLVGKVKIIRADTLQEGWELFQKNPDLDLIIMDACVPGDKPNAMPLVREIRRRGFDKPIIASSSITAYCNLLVEAGATHTVDSKNEAPKCALQLLGLD